MREIYIDVVREGYGPDQVKRTMTVGELIAFLDQFDEDRPVYISHDNGYTYGGIREQSFRDPENEL